MVIVGDAAYIYEMLLAGGENKYWLCTNCKESGHEKVESCNVEPAFGSINRKGELQTVSKFRGYFYTVRGLLKKIGTVWIAWLKLVPGKST